MANSKTPRPNKNVTTSNVGATSQAGARKIHDHRVAVAYSGGLDSTALLHATIAAHGSENVIAFHVNHGLQKQADQWLLHCANQAERFGIEFDFRLLELGSRLGVERNIEAQARQARYEALRQMCFIHGVKNLLLAHHQDDQAETILLQLLRGSGVAGLSSMPIVRGSDQKDLRLWRPFLELSRSEIEAYANEHHLEWIEDPSNADERFTRNALRRRVMPWLEKIQPNVKQNLSRSAGHLAQAQHLLECLADIDLQGMETDGVLKLKSLLALKADDAARASNALRRWLQKSNLAMPSEERLNGWWQDLESSGPQAQIEWLHDQHRLKVWRGNLTAQPVRQSELAQSGHWIFDHVSQPGVPGLPEDLFEEAMRAGKIHELGRQGGEKLRIDVKRPRRTLKNLFQEADIPPWQREAPILYLGDEILAVAGIGMNADLTTEHGLRVVACWVAE